MNKIESDWTSFSGLGIGDTSATLPIQAIPKSRKKKKWKIATMDALESIGLSQLHKNIRFAQYRKMSKGEFSYSAVGIEETELPWFNKEVRKLRDKLNIPTYLKHFDFIGIIVNTLEGIYSDFEDRFIVDSRDEYSTNEFIRQKTEKLHQYARAVFMQEVNKLLLMRGVDPFKADFQSEEEAQAYQQQLQQQIQSLTPPEIERSLSKNFKVLATEWAQNTLDEDAKEFGIPLMDKENFVDYILTGRYFKHFGVGYDNYFVERWEVEEVFFSEDVDARYPQEGEFIGRIRNMSPSNILNRFGHLMTTAQQEGIGNYWNQSKDFENKLGVRADNIAHNHQEAIFPTDTVVPFHNYFDHQANVQLENALGIPMGKTTTVDDDGEEHTFSSWIPKIADGDTFRSDLYSSYLRDDIDVRQDTVRVTEAYWRSYKRLGVLIFENDLGSVSVELTTDDLLPDFLKDREISKLRNISIQELQTALKENKLYEYVNTITYLYVPEIWKGVKIRGNGTTVKEDLYLDVRPLDYQIKGSRSNIYNINLPVAGIITTGLIKKIFPYQQLHNISMNQITELLEKELGVFFSLDITGLPSEYQDETTEESIYRAREIIKDTGLLPLDLSRQNTQGNNPNVFQRQEVVFASQVQYRWQLAQQYKQDALSQIGITPQMIGAPNTYTTAEGVKQGMQASYAVINPIFERFNEAKGKEMELHIAVAQFCHVNGKDSTVLYRKGDGELSFLDILAEDGELFPLRHLGVTAINSSKDRKIIEQLRGMLINDNTMTKSFEDALEILTNNSIVELKEIAQNIERKTRKQQQDDRDFQSQMQQQALQAQAQQNEAERQHELDVENLKGQYRLAEERIQAYAQFEDNSSINNALIDRIDKTTQDSINNDFRSQEIAVKQQEVERKSLNDAELRNMELMKLQQKSEELRLKREALATQRYTSTINKN